MRGIVAEIDENMFMSPSPVPMAVRVRIELNKKGIRFEDDGRPSAIVNLSPPHIITSLSLLETDVSPFPI